MTPTPRQIEEESTPLYAIHAAADALVTQAKRRSLALGTHAHEAVGVGEFAALAAALCGQGANETARLRAENAALKQALGLHNLEVEPARPVAAHLPAHIASALRLVGDYCAREGYGSCVVPAHGGAAFEHHDVLGELIAARRGAPGLELSDDDRAAVARMSQ